MLLVGASFTEHKGSAAILMATLQIMEKKFPCSQFFFCSFNPRKDSINLRVPNLYVIPYTFKNKRSLELILSALYVRLTKHDLANMPITTCMKNADVILDISGDTFASEYGMGSILSKGIRVLSAKLLKKPIVFYCQSIGPFDGKIDKTIAKFFLKLCDLTIVREHITEKYLRTIGLSVFVGADPVFLLEPSSLPEGLLNLPTGKRVIGVNLSQYIDALYGGKHPENKYRQLMAQFIDCLIERYNVHILILPEVIKQTGAPDDYSVSTEIVSKLTHKEAVSIIEGDHAPSELKAIVGCCDIVISPRFHMIIFALSQCIPSIAIAYSPKAHGIMQTMGQSEFVLNHEDLTLDLLLAKFEKLWSQKTEVRETVKTNMVETSKRALFAAELVNVLLEKKRVKQY